MVKVAMLRLGASVTIKESKLQLIQKSHFNYTSIRNNPGSRLGAFA